MRRVLFHRDYRGFKGGHLKVYDYFNHTRATAGFDSAIYLSPGSVDDGRNPWLQQRILLEKAWLPERSKILFLAGLDWLSVPELVRKNRGIIKVNLIQGLRHANPDHRLFQFLQYPAIRICVSAPVADAISNTGSARGPIVTIPAGLDYSSFPRPVPFRERHTDLLIFRKAPGDGSGQLQAVRSSGVRVQEVGAKPMPRAEFLDALASAKVVVLFPMRQEGFFLPALEAMALGAIVVCPDVGGNRAFCIDRVNCFLPPYEEAAIERAVLEALHLPDQQAEEMVNKGFQTAREHSIEAEREAYHRLLGDLDLLWKQI